MKYLCIYNVAFGLYVFIENKPLKMFNLMQKLYWVYRSRAALLQTISLRA